MQGRTGWHCCCAMLHPAGQAEVSQQTKVGLMSFNDSLNRLQHLQITKGPVCCSNFPCRMLFKPLVSLPNKNQDLSSAVPCVSMVYLHPRRRNPICCAAPDRALQSPSRQSSHDIQSLVWHGWITGTICRQLSNSVKLQFPSSSSERF